MTTNDYPMAMIQPIDEAVGIAELKAKLSEHLRRVRQGSTLTVFDRETPVARIVPYEREATPLRIRSPKLGASRPGDFEFPAPLGLDVDVVELLLQDRRNDRLPPVPASRSRRHSAP